MPEQIKYNMVGRIIYFVCVFSHCRDRMITVAQRLNTETDRRGRKAHGRPMNYFGFSDLDPLEYPEIPPRQYTL